MFALAVVAAAAGVIGAAVTGGGSLGITFAIIAGGAGVGPAGIDWANETAGGARDRP